MGRTLVPQANVTERALLGVVETFLRERIPPDWQIRIKASRVDMGYDATVDLTDSTAVSGTIRVQLKQTVSARIVDSISARAGADVLLVSRYLTPSARARATENGLSYLDATGNSRITLSRPGLWIETQGASDDPWRARGRPTATLRGVPGAKIVRLLLDTSGPWTVRQIAERADVSIGSVYRAVDYLDGEALIERDRGRVDVPDWSVLLRAWANEYGFIESNAVSRWIAPRGLEALTKRITEVGSIPGDYAITGSLAVPDAARYAPARNAMIYVSDPSAAADAWGLRAADTGINVLLAEPRSTAPFVRTQSGAGGLVLAAPAQVACDLINGPGRAPEEADELIAWMEKNERNWRR